MRRAVVQAILLLLTISSVAAWSYTLAPSKPTGSTASDGSAAGSTTPSGTASCPSSKYRSLDSSCANPSNPQLGRAGEPFGRLLPPNYADGNSSPPIMSNGSEYVNARTISFNLFSIDETPDPSKTLINIFFLQAIGNDLSFPAGSADTVPCCVGGQLVSNAPNRCFPVKIPDRDALYSFFNIRCLNYARGLTKPGSTPVQQINSASSLLDLSFLYGSSVPESNRLRAFSGGRMLTVRRNNLEWPVIDTNGCTWADVCYVVADTRSYQTPMAATVHLIFLREHNRLANQLRLLNSGWSDETIFQEARRINIAQYQYIVYYEYLPQLMGRANMLASRLIFEGNGFATDYNPFQNPASLGEFGAVVVPFMQSQLPGGINFYMNDTVRTLRLSDLAGNLTSLESMFGNFFTGLTTQSTKQIANSFSIEWKNFMYRGDESLGQDLLALDIQRMRDFGFARYIDYRMRLGLSRITTWEAFNVTLKQQCYKTVQQLRLNYPTIDDLDLFVGAAFEDPIEGSMVGPTYYRILEQQFLAARTGDRYFFEAGGQQGSFTLAQLTEIRKISLSRLMCAALPTTLKIQPNAFVPISDSNKPVACSALPVPNLAAWRA